MAILDLLERLNASYRAAPHPLKQKSAQIKKSYLLGLAMQAHADHHLHVLERAHFLDVARAFDVAEDTANALLAMAAHPTESVVRQIRKHLIHTKNSYYLIIDLVIMAHQDRELKPVERAVVANFGELFAIDADDVDFLTDLANAVVSEDLALRRQWVDAFFEKATIQRLAPEDFAHYTETPGVKADGRSANDR